MSCKPGDKVQLKTGGPVMVVRSVKGYGDLVNADCDWIDKEGKPQSVNYYLNMLERDQDKFDYEQGSVIVG